MKQTLLLLVFFTTHVFSQTPAKSLNFDGVNDYVNITNQTQVFNYNASSTFTIEFWVKPSDKTTSQAIIGKGSRTAGRGYIVRLLNNRIYFRNRDVIIGGTATAISTTAWSHVAITYNATAVKIYINGVLKQSGSLSIVPFNAATAHKMFIGARRADTGNSSTRQRHFKGNLDELRFWNVVKTASEIVASKDCGLIGTEANLVSYFKFDQGFDNQNNSTQTTLVNTNTTYNGTLNSFALSGATSNFAASTVVTSNCNTLSIDEQSLTTKVSVFPNPSNGQITISNGSSLNLKKAVITDVNGRNIKTINLSQTQSNDLYDISYLTSGLYFLTINSENITITKKLIIE